MHRPINSLSIVFIAACMSQMAAAEQFTLTVPGRNWTLAFDTLPLENFAGQSRDGVFNFRAAGEGINLSIFVEEPKNVGAGHEACFEHYWPLAKRNPTIDQTSAVVTKTTKFVKVEYAMKVPGAAMTARNMNLFFAFQGRWIDVHLSRFPAAADDDEVFARFAESLVYQATNVGATVK